MAATRGEGHRATNKERIPGATTAQIRDPKMRLAVFPHVTGGAHCLAIHSVMGVLVHVKKTKLGVPGTPPGIFKTVQFGHFSEQNVKKSVEFHQKWRSWTPPGFFQICSV